MVDIGRTFGALMIGGIIAAVFSGMVTSQAFSYFKYYTNDPRALRGLVALVWFLDFCHTIFITTALWDHLIAHFGDAARIDFIPWSLAITIAFTAVLTFLVHLFFVYRIFKLSKNNYIVAVPLAILACARLVVILTGACYIFTFGRLDYNLSVLSSPKEAQKEFKSKPHTGLVDAIHIRNWVDNLWLTMHTNLIFMGIHFVISKFYANSLLATLNARKTLHPTSHRAQGSYDRNMPIMFPNNSFGLSSNNTPSLKIKIDETKMSRSDGTSSGSGSRNPSTVEDHDVKSRGEMDVC
ncbi:hypothetical protein JR316_0000044 [Psilocybe cubensis]|uniref:Uncharacterized protein n=2 Tax=Psilocybe cubensis TaxID=181762 RepID=A0ACB8HEC2_PSICU|nr:hypothetical protein JR316_0000044 [Psilocybe cubensis]KAH9485982.1 hypothetical protein JR316_0000044 [Psilocybe cubensis]